MAAAHASITASGSDVIGVGAAAPYQAQHLMAKTIPFPLYLDAGGRVADALGLQRQSLPAFLFNLRAWLRWVRAFVRRRRQYRITGHYSEVPAVAIVSAAGTVEWLHRGRSIGDYPALAGVLQHLGQEHGEPSPG